MRCKVERSAMRAVVNRMRSATARLTTVPVLAHVRVEAKKDRLYLQATDLDLTLDSNIPAEVAEDGAASVSCVQLWRMLGILPSPWVNLELDGRALRISGSDGEARLLAMPAEDWPRIDAASAEVEPLLSLPAATWRDAVDGALFVVPKDVSRFLLNHAMIVPGEERFRLEATDGYRLSVVEADAPAVAEELPVAREALRISRMLAGETVTLGRVVGSGGAYRALTVGDYKLTYRIAESPWPEFHRVIGPEPLRRASVDRAELQGIIGLLAESIGPGRCVVLSTAGGTFAVEADDYSGVSIARTIASAEVDGSGVRVGMQARFLLDFLKLARKRKVERIEIGLRSEHEVTRLSLLGDKSSARLTHHCVMPMRFEDDRRLWWAS